MYYTDYISSRIYSVAIYLYISTPISPPLPLTGRTAPNAPSAHTALPLPSAARSRPRPLASPAVEAPSPHSPREGRPPPRLPIALFYAQLHRLVALALLSLLPISHTDPLRTIACAQLLRPWWPWQQRQAGSHQPAPARVRGCLTPIIIEINARKVNKQLRQGHRIEETRPITVPVVPLKRLLYSRPSGRISATGDQMRPP